MNFNDIPYIPVASSHVGALKHDGMTCMRVLYKDGAEYDFSPVSASEFESVRYSESVGKALHAIGVKGHRVRED